MNIYQKLLQMDCSASEEKIRSMIFDDPFQFIDYGQDAILKRCYVSRATLYRFCDALEVNGLSELKMRLRVDYDSYQSSRENFDFDYPVKDGVTPTTIVRSLKEDYEKTAVATYNLFDSNTLHRCALEMKRASVVDIYASAGNIYFADNFRFQMAEIGKEVKVPHEQYLHSLTAASSDETHFAIMISYGARGVMVKDELRILKEKHTKVLLVSSSEAEDIQDLAEYHLYLPAIENHYQKISSFSTRFSLLYILDALYTCYFELDYEKNLKAKTTFYETMVNKKPEDIR